MPALVRAARSRYRCLLSVPASSQSVRISNDSARSWPWLCLSHAVLRRCGNTDNNDYTQRSLGLVLASVVDSRHSTHSTLGPADPPRALPPHPRPMYPWGYGGTYEIRLGCAWVVCGRVPTSLLCSLAFLCVENRLRVGDAVVPVCEADARAFGEGV